MEEQLSSSGQIDNLGNMISRSPSPTKKITMLDQKNANDDMVRVVSFAGGQNPHFAALAAAEYAQNADSLLMKKFSED